MDPALFRFALIVRLVVFMALVYLALDALVARLSRKPDSKLRWFFDVLARPLTAPARYFLPDASPGQIRLVSAALLVVIWMAAVWLGSAVAVVGGGTVPPPE